MFVIISLVQHCVQVYLHIVCVWGVGGSFALIHVRLAVSGEGVPDKSRDNRTRLRVLPERTTVRPLSSTIPSAALSLPIY